MRTRMSMVAMILCVFIAAFCVGAPGGASATASQRDLDAKLDELDSVNERVDRARQQLLKYGKEEKNAIKALQSAEDKLLKVEQQMTKTNRDLKAAEVGLAAAERELAASEVKLVDLSKDYDLTLGSLEARLIGLYKMGSASYLELLLESRDFADFVTRYDFLHIVIAQNAADMEGLKQAKTDLETQRAEISARKTELELKRRDITSLAQSLKKQQAESENLAGEREYYLSRVVADKAQWQKLLAEEERQSRELEKTIRDLQSSMIRSFGSLTSFLSRM